MIHAFPCRRDDIVSEGRHHAANPARVKNAHATAEQRRSLCDAFPRVATKAGLILFATGT